MKWLLILFFWTICLEATPSQVLIIRHGEKLRDSNDLSLKGFERAAALAPYLTCNFDGPPIALYAQRPTDEDLSQRTVQTLTPLANQLNIRIHTFAKNDYPAMVEEILSKPEYEGKSVLISWSHHLIPALAKCFGVAHPPDKWGGKIFDRVWVIKFNKEKVTFRDAPQKLLFGDSPS